MSPEEPSRFANFLGQTARPSFVVANSPRRATRIDGASCVGTAEPLGEFDPLADEYFRAGIPGGDVLVVDARIGCSTDDLPFLLARLKSEGRSIIEFARTGDEVEVAVDGDVRTITRAEFDDAIVAGRVLFVWEWGSMGDSYVEFGTGQPGVPLDSGGLVFLFAEGSHLAPGDLPPSRSLNAWDRVEDFFAPFESEFLRELGPAQPSPELSRWIAARVERQDGHFGDGASKSVGALALHETQFYVFGVRPDGTVMRIDYEALTWPSSVETDPRVVYATLRHGATKYPELAPLLPTRPRGVVRCASCGGRGAWMRDDGVIDQCIACDAMGFRVG